MSEDKKIILVVEDEVAMLEALANKLSKSGFEVLKAPDGEAGLELASKEKPDLIMLDIIMPKMDGLALAKKIREIKPWGINVPIIMLTNLNEPGSIADAAKFGVFDFLVKTDWRLDDVVKLVKEKLQAN